MACIILIILLLFPHLDLRPADSPQICEDIKIIIPNGITVEHSKTRCAPNSTETSCNSSRSHIRTFINGGNSDEFLAQNFDIFAWGNLNAKSLNPGAINLLYEYLDMVQDDRKSQALLDYCDLYGLTSNDIEDMFLHAKEDVNYTLGQPKELDPKVTKLVPGWDPLNDLNGDYQINETEFAVRANPNASARYKNESRIPIYYWGPPTDHQINPGDANYQDFIVTYYFPDILVEGYDGLWIDTLHTYPTLQKDTIVLEYPDLGQYALDVKTILTNLVDFLPDDMIIIGNGWYSDPIIISGNEYENWARITTSIDSAKLDTINKRDDKRIMQLIQYKPIYHEVANPNRPDLFVEGITLERDQLYSLALYYLVHGNHTFYGYGVHGGYDLDEEKWFDAINYDIGQPLDSYYVFDDSSGYTKKTENFLANGNFEIDNDTDGNPDFWQPAEPVELDYEIKYEGNCSVRIESDMEINNINWQSVTLEPNTTYTLSGRIKTENVTGQGAQIYIYEFDDLQESDPWIVITGTTDWTFHSMTFTTGSDAEGNIKFRIKHGAGTAWFDDFHLTYGTYQKYTVFAREFQNATVLLRTPLNIGDYSAITYDLDESYRLLRANGSLGDPVNTIEIMGGEGLILIKEGEDVSPPFEDLYLKQGWNLISLPLVQNETQITAVLNSIVGDYNAVQWFNKYDTNDPWKNHMEGKPYGNDLYELNETMGFWIHIINPGDTIFLYNGTQPTSNQTIHLYPGWNMVGYPSLTSYNRTEDLNNLTYGDQVDAIWSYDASTQKWKEMEESDHFQIGKGYYIHAKSECEWEVPL